VRAIHTAFGLTRIVNLFVLGCGRVARAFLRQLHESRAARERQLGLELRVIGVATSRQCLLDDAGLDPTTAAERLATADARPSDDELLARLAEGRFTDLVLCDLTAADTASLHRKALEAGIHVVTANKIPLAGALTDYLAIRRAARETGARYGYETTFGAGLPVLHTLQELVMTGDEIRSIAGCFSGTLGFVCTRLEQGASLADAIREAEQKGLTEPDPREDLSGRDVGRKALIIARAVGLEIEPDAVAIEPFVPDLELGLDEALARHGASIERRTAELRAAGQVLRFVAEITPPNVTVGLRAMAVDDPIGRLWGMDNMLVYRTERYSDHPLVIRGPGAGAEVTAAGVLGDVLKVARL
jgi:aspartokinase/homoserine dehydrogenase 1